MYIFSFSVQIRPKMAFLYGNLPNSSITTINYNVTCVYAYGGVQHNLKRLKKANCQHWKIGRETALKRAAVTFFGHQYLRNAQTEDTQKFSSVDAEPRQD